MAQQNGLLYASVTITLKVGADNIRVTPHGWDGNGVILWSVCSNINGFPKTQGVARCGGCFADMAGHRESETQVATLQFSTAWRYASAFRGGGNL